MSGRLIDITPSAYSYPLLIKQLLHSSMLHAANQEIVYRDQKRFSYRTLRERKAPGVTEVAVIGVKDEKWGERPVALVVRDPQAETAPTENSIKSHVGQFADTRVISKYAIPRTVLFVDHLERTSVGKIDKKQLRKRYAQDE